MGRSLWFTLVTLVGAGIILATGHFFYPIQEWLFWRYFGYWAACLVWAYACTGFGYVALRKIVRVQMPALELLTCAFALGMASFAISMCLAGFLQLYKTALFFALPLLFLAIGGRPLTAFLHRRLAFGKGSLLAGARLSWSQVGLLGFGVFGLLLIYIGVVTPETVQFDARWKHLALAEDFVAYGGIHRFPEGWVFATRPHLASWLYVWAFLSSDLLFDKIVLSQHLEFTVFLFTAWIAVPALVRRLVPDANPSLVWVARFLYPGVWLYDSSLSAGADHIGAALAIPMLLLGWRAWRRLDPRYVLLLSLVMASAFMVKETLAAMLVPLPALAVAIRIVQFTIAKARGRLAADVHRKWWTVPFVAIAAVLVWSAPHWARNLVWYGDPLYPILFRHFDSRPWLPDSDYSYVWGYLSVQMDQPPGGWQGLWQTIKVVFTFPLLPHDWPAFHGNVPVFGAVISVLWPVLLLVRKTRPTWVVLGAIHFCVICWFWLHHQDRYLQGIMPVIAAATAAMVILVWRQGNRLAQVGLAILLAAQVVWGGDVFFMHRVPLRNVEKLFGAGHRRDYVKRFETQGDYSKIGKRLPKDGHVLMHENHPHLGIAHTSVSDWPTWQFGLSYGSMDSPRAIYEQLKAWGVTHVVWKRGSSRSWDSVAGDLMFFNFAMRHTDSVKKVGSHAMAKMPKELPPDAEHFEDSVLVVGCGKSYRDGLYRVTDLQVPSFGPERTNHPDPRLAAKNQREAWRWISSANFVVREKACSRRPDTHLETDFELAVSRRPHRSYARERYEIWIRKTDVAAAKPWPKVSQPRPTSTQVSQQKAPVAPESDGNAKPSEANLPGVGAANKLVPN